MPANIDKMFYYGERPWHGLGQELNHPATAAEAISASGLGWKVDKLPLHFPPTYLDGKEIPGKFSIVREDNNSVLGIVSEAYRPIQNQEAFTFFDQVVGEGQAIYHTAGSIGKGEHIWIMAKLPHEIKVTKEDIVSEFLLLTNSHNGTTSLRMFYTPIRVVCQNTLNLAIQKAGKEGVTIWHTGDIQNKTREAQEILGLAHKFYTQFQESTSRLVKRQLSESEVRKYFQKVFPKKEGKEPQTKLIHEELLRLFEAGRGNDLKGVRGTAWAAFNAVTEFVDFSAGFRKPQKDVSSGRLYKIWFGTGARIKVTAWNTIMKTVALN